mmetsp:Transcript_9564/g.21867  ORF Transcript_9564/g.21867 Transcript_9564/m.21867 type:complete len:100 (-) Transcript_9564:803-1102(-)
MLTLRQLQHTNSAHGLLPAEKPLRTVQRWLQRNLLEALPISPHSFNPRIRAAWPGCNNGDKTNWSTMHTARKNDGKTNPPSRSAQQTITGYLTLRGQLD